MNDYLNKISSPIITVIGSILLIIGSIAAFLGPAESYCYYLFSEHGMFHYEGFGVGSFMFGQITMQIWGYYIIALICIPLGYGHIKKYLWVKKISLTLLYVWFIVGIPILPILLFILVTNKEPSLLLIIASTIFCLLSYTLIPIILIKFYKSKSVELVLKRNGNTYNFIDKYPIPLLMILLIYIFYIFAFHVLLLFRGIFPLFGQWIINFKGTVLNTLSILYLITIIIGTVSKKLWSWWASFLYFVTFTVSLLITLLVSDFAEIVTLLNLPARELQALINIPLKGIHLTLLFGLPLILTLGVIIFSRTFFSFSKQTQNVQNIPDRSSGE